jgi:hypothetical protein
MRARRLISTLSAAACALHRVCPASVPLLPSEAIATLFTMDRAVARRIIVRAGICRTGSPRADKRSVPRPPYASTLSSLSVDAPAHLVSSSLTAARSALAVTSANVVPLADAKHLEAGRYLLEVAT